MLRANSAERSVIERRASSVGTSAQTTGAWDHTSALGLASQARESLEALFDELARLAALFDTNDAPSLMSDCASQRRLADRWPRLWIIAAETCESRTFTAMYVTTSFSFCFGRAPIAASTTVPENSNCDADTAPPILHCFKESTGYLPIDCPNGSSVWCATATRYLHPRRSIRAGHDQAREQPQ